MLDRLEVLEAVAAGKLTLAQGGEILGQTDAAVSRQLEVLELAGALAKRQMRVAKRKLKAVAAVASVVIALTSTVWLVYPAWAAGMCAQTLPGGMNTMCPNEPAKAAEVNTNFQLLANYLTAKTGALGTNTNLAAGPIVSTGTITANSTIRGKAANTAQGFELDWNRSVGSGSTDLVNYKDTGPGGFNFWNGATKIAEINNNGDMISQYATHTYANITNTATIANATITFVNGRRPVAVVTNNCATGSCSATCPVGIVKMGWGFHGVNGQTTNFDPQAGVCGKATTWMGACINGTSCTINTACGSSSIYLECW